MDENNRPGSDKNKPSNDEDIDRIDFDSFKLEADPENSNNSDETEVDRTDDTSDSVASEAGFGSSKKIDVMFSDSDTPDSSKGETTSFADDKAEDKKETSTSDSAGVQLVDTEIEPSTVAMPIEQGGGVSSEKAEVSPSTVGAEPNTVATTPPSIGGDSTGRLSDRKRLIIIASAALVMITVVVLAWVLSTRGVKEDTSKNDNTLIEQPAPVEVPKLGMTVAATGTVELMQGDASWQPLEAETAIQEGDQVRTGDDSRATLTLENGSVARLDENTTVLIKSLSTDSVEIEHIEGRMYSRVIPGEGQYYVWMSDVAYEALGTAFITFKSLGENGVQVYHGSVGVEGIDEGVAEGQQYYRASNDLSLAGKVSELDIDGLTTDEFVAWNREEDEKNPTFQGSLGVLAKIKERAEAMEKEEQEKARLEEERKRQAAEQAERERREAEARASNEDEEEGSDEDE